MTKRRRKNKPIPPAPTKTASVMVLCKIGQEGHPYVLSTALKQATALAATDKRRVVWHTWTSELITAGTINTLSGGPNVELGEAMHAIRYTFDTEPGP